MCESSSQLGWGRGKGRDCISNERLKPKDETLLRVLQQPFYERLDCAAAGAGGANSLDDLVLEYRCDLAQPIT